MIVSPLRKGCNIVNHTCHLYLYCPSLLGTCGLEQQISATYMNKSFIFKVVFVFFLFFFLRESVTYSFTYLYREVFLNIYFKG